MYKQLHVAILVINNVMVIIFCVLHCNAGGSHKVCDWRSQLLYGQSEESRAGMNMDGRTWHSSYECGQVDA